MVHATLYAYSRQDGTLKRMAGCQTFSDYNATHQRNPAFGARAPFYIPTGTRGWEAWAQPLLDLTTEYGVIHTSGPRGVSSFEVLK